MNDDKSRDTFTPRLDSVDPRDPPGRLATKIDTPKAECVPKALKEARDRNVYCTRKRKR